MTTVVQPKNLWHSMPGWGIVANLMPPELIDARRAHALRRLIVAALIAIALLAGVGYGYEYLRGNAASAALSRAQATGTQLTAEQAKYGGVVLIQDGTSHVQDQLAGLMGYNVDVQKVVGTLRSSVLPGMAIGQLQVSINANIGASGAGDSSANAAANLDTTGDEHIGTITMSGSALHFGDVSAFVNRLNATTGLIQVFPTNIQSNASGVKFTLQMTMTQALLTRNYLLGNLGGK